MTRWTHIHWEDDPGGHIPMLKIEHADHRYTKDYLVISDRAVGVVGHWFEDRKRNGPCLDPFAPCPCREQPLPTWWRCYLAALDKGGKVRLVEITKDAWLACRGQGITDKRGTLRGMRVTLAREPRIKTGAVVCQLLEPVSLPDDYSLPAAPNIKVELERIWFSRM